MDGSFLGENTVIKVQGFPITIFISGFSGNIFPLFEIVLIAKKTIIFIKIIINVTFLS